MSCLKAIGEIKIQLSAKEFLDAGPDNVRLLYPLYYSFI